MRFRDSSIVRPPGGAGQVVELALSIRQPWVDLILRGLKTIEVREWPIRRRGPFFIHASSSLDWRAVELFGYEDALSLQRGGIVGHAEIVDVVQLTDSVWLERLDQHRVVHQRRLPQYGAVLQNVRALGTVVRCSGRRYFFPLPQGVATSASRALKRLDRIDVDRKAGEGGAP